MNDSYAIGVDIEPTELTIALVNNQREVCEIFHTATMSQRDLVANIAEISCGNNSQLSQDGIGERYCLSSFIMVLSEALESVKNVTVSLPGTSSFSLNTTFQCPWFSQPGVVF